MTKKENDETIKSWNEYPLLLEVGLEELIEQRQQWDNAKKEAEQELKGLNANIQAYLMAAEVKKVMVGEWNVTQCNGKSASTLDPRKLMVKGVSPDIIAECWNEGTAYTYLQVKARGKEGKA